MVGFTIVCAFLSSMLAFNLVLTIHIFVNTLDGRKHSKKEEE